MSKRPGSIYGFPGYHPRSLLHGRIKIVWIYVGKTRQRPEARWRQHQYGSPNGEPPKVWWPLVTDQVVLKRRRRISNAGLDWRESWQITKRWPIANISLNRLNPRRIPPWEMKTLMQQINAAGGVQALVRRAEGRERTTAGWSFSEDGSTVEFYGREADRVCETWLPPSTGFSLSSGEPSEPQPESMWRKLVSGFTGRVRV